jgi:tetratricopeptide (TPR) repeat protein
VDDYYEIVGVDRVASRDVIDRKIRDQMRIWQRRTANADLDRRQEAERKVKQLGEARTTLLDEEKRRTYDRKLTAYRSSEPPPAPHTSVDATATTATTGTWLAQARRYLADNDHQAAAYAARETLRTTPNPPPEVWTILARANSALGRLDDALFEARRAVTTDPDNPEAHLALAQVLEQREEWGEAGQAYAAAGRLNPQAEAPQLGLAMALVRSGRVAAAMDVLERRYTGAPDRSYAGRWLARSLVTLAEAVARPPGATGYRITSPAQLGQVRRILNRARQVCSEPAILSSSTELERYLASRERYGLDPTTSTTTTSGSRYDALRTSYRVPAQASEYAPVNALAVVSLVFAIVGAGLCLFAPVGAVLGHVARGQALERVQRGGGLALAGIVVGWVATAAWCIGGIGMLNGL